MEHDNLKGKSRQLGYQHKLRTYRLRKEHHPAGYPTVSLSSLEPVTPASPKKTSPHQPREAYAGPCQPGDPLHRGPTPLIVKLSSEHKMGKTLADEGLHDPTARLRASSLPAGCNLNFDFTAGEAQHEKLLNMLERETTTKVLSRPNICLSLLPLSC
jgi:hypothetical protein